MSGARHVLSLQSAPVLLSGEWYLETQIRALRVLTVLGPLCGQSQEMYVGIEEHRNQHTHTHIHTDGYYSNICLLIFKTVSL